MGLDTTHGAFHGAYSAFDNFRKFVLESIGGNYPPHEDKTLLDGHWYWDANGRFGSDTHNGLEAFFAHSDCDGELSPELCKLVADELEEILPFIEERATRIPAYGHILRDGGYVAVTKRFIGGCRLAHKQNEPLLFR